MVYMLLESHYVTFRVLGGMVDGERIVNVMVVQSKIFICECCTSIVLHFVALL